MRNPLLDTLKGIATGLIPVEIDIPVGNTTIRTTKRPLSVSHGSATFTDGSLYLSSGKVINNGPGEIKVL